MMMRVGPVLILGHRVRIRLGYWDPYWFWVTESEFDLGTGTRIDFGSQSQNSTWVLGPVLMLGHRVRIRLGYWDPYWCWVTESEFDLGTGTPIDVGSQSQNSTWVLGPVLMLGHRVRIRLGYWDPYWCWVTESEFDLGTLSVKPSNSTIHTCYTFCPITSEFTLVVDEERRIPINLDYNIKVHGQHWPPVCDSLLTRYRL